jgi:hypothetical protein
MPAAPLYLPAAQSVTADAPSKQKPPAKHCLHCVEPVPSWYVPAAHWLQAPCPCCAANVPVLHRVDVVEPVLQNEPTGHCEQPDTDDSPAVPLYRPAGHSVTADAPSPQYPPAVPHCTQSVAPPLDWYVPAAHLVQAPCPNWLLNVPVLHAVSAVLPMLQYVPAAQLAHPEAADSPTALL